MKTETIYGNFLISVFNGWAYENIDDFIKDRTSTELHNYHEDWNKLIPVVKKIKGNYKHISQLWKDIMTAWTDLDILKTWQAVVAYIKWFYPQKSPA